MHREMIDVSLCRWRHISDLSGERSRQRSGQCVCVRERESECVRRKREQPQLSKGSFHQSLEAGLRYEGETKQSFVQKSVPRLRSGGV